jgi:hypothetical protein
MRVGGEPSTRWQGEFKKRLSYRRWNVLQHEAIGVRSGMIMQNAAVKVLLNKAMSIMVQPMNLEGRGCAGRARSSR